MTCSAAPPVGGVATGSSNSAAINIPFPQCWPSCGCSCNCSCKNCSCRSRVDIIDPNADQHGGEGTLLDRAGQASLTQPTSYTTTSSAHSVQESSDAPVPTARPVIAPTNLDTIRELHGREHPARVRQINVDRYMNEAIDDECPWKHFLEKSFTSDAVDGDAGLFGPMDLDDSMRNNHVPLGSGEQSMLSSFMSSLSLHTPSVGLSDVVRGAGDVFGPRADPRPPGHSYLRLN